MGTVLGSISIAKNQSEQPLHRRPTVRSGFWPRIVVVGLLSVAAYTFVVADMFSDVLAGSRAVFVVVLPVLTTMIAAGYRRPPRGVGDSESDWIIAAIGSAIGLTAIRMITDRLPAEAALFHLDLVGIVIWVAATSMVLLGVRYVVRMWDMWLFALSCSSPLPFLLAGSLVGGSDTALAIIAAALASIAVLLAGRTHDVTWRAGAAATCLVVGTGSVFALGALVPDNRHPIGLLVQVIVAAAIVPVLTTLGMHRLAPFVHKPRPAVTAPGFPHRAPLTYFALVGFTVIQLLAHLPAPATVPPPPAAADWARRSGLDGPSGFGFVSRFLGPDTTLVRYSVPNVEGAPNAAVDVITTPNLGALRDFYDAVWYPTPTPVNFGDAHRPIGRALQVRTVHSDADAATTSSNDQWYALTWEWRVPSGFQQVTVIVSQDDAPHPPEPRPLSTSNTVAEPALWVARGQPSSIGRVSGAVVDRAGEIAERLFAAAGTNNV